MSVAVIIPCHSYPELLPRAIESVRNQTVLPDRILLCLDGVDPLRYADPVSDLYPDKRIAVVAHANVGVAATMNLALEGLDSEWYFRLDEDDEMRPRALEYLLKSTTLMDCAIHYSDWVRMGKWRGYITVPEFSKEQLLHGPFILSAALVKTSMWAAVKEANGDGYDTGIDAWEDYLFYLEAACLGFEGTRVGLPLVRYYRHGQSRSSGVDKCNTPVVNYIQDKLDRLYNTRLLYGRSH